MPSVPSTRNYDIFWNNLEISMQHVSIQLAHAEDVSGRSRTVYYRAACIFLAANVEALLHAVVDKAVHNGAEIPPKEEWRDISDRQLINSYANTNIEKLVIVKMQKIITPVNLDGFLQFQQIAKLAVEMGLVTNRKKLIGRIDSVRVLRNRIHIMTLDVVDRKYNKAMVDKVGAVFNELLAILETI